LPEEGADIMTDGMQDLNDKENISE